MKYPKCDLDKGDFVIILWVFTIATTEVWERGFRVIASFMVILFVLFNILTLIILMRKRIRMEGKNGE